MLDTLELIIADVTEGIKAISLVNDPAIEENWVALSKQEVNLKTIDEEKRIVIGVALIPDKKILRSKGDYKFNILFSKDTVKKAAHLFMKSLRNNHATIEHEVKAEGIGVVESWIVEDEKNDKSNIYKLGAKEGSWVVIMSIESDQVWSDIKEGKYKGFSIEGIFAEKKADLSKNEDEEAQEMINKLKDFLANNK